MTENGGSKPGPAPGDRTVIGITFGNSNSSIAFTVDDKAEVIANEDGGETIVCCVWLNGLTANHLTNRPTNTYDPVLR